MNNPKVSIVTVVFNGEQYLEQTILSVLKQTYQNIEYIIIDGGSVDGSVEIIKKYEDRISYWISEKDKGISDAFNKGILKCTGQIIGIISSDDWYELNAVELVIDNFENGDVIHGNLQSWANEKKDYIFSANVKSLPKDMTINHHTMFVKRSVYEKYGLFKLEYKYAMDYELALRFYLKGVSFSYIPQILANARLSGITEKHWESSIKESIPAKVENGINKNTALLYYYFRYLRGKVARVLNKYGLTTLIKFYRKYFSISKKHLG